MISASANRSEIVERTTAAEREYRAGLAAMTAAARAVGAPVNATQALILCRMKPADRLCVKELLADCYDGSNPTYNVQALCRHGYIARRPDPMDGRRARLALTESGRSLREALLDRLSEAAG